MTDRKEASRAFAVGNDFRPLPALDLDNREFWTGGEQGNLMIHCCGECGKLHHPPAPVCPLCLSRAVAPRKVSGRGEVVSFTVNHQPWRADMVVPFVIAFVSVEEQPDVWLMTNIVNCSPIELRIGLKVRVIFERRDDVWLPLFEPIATAANPLPLQVPEPLTKENS